MYKIEPDDPKGRIRVKSWGCWSLETTKAYAADIGELLPAMRQRHEHIDLLIDLRDAVALPKDAAEYMAQAVQAQASMGIRKIAHICPTVLQSIQARRLTIGVFERRSFDAEEDALAWLNE